MSEGQAEDVSGGSYSRLGTQSHWASVYDRELQNFRDNKDDPGDIWYGEKAQVDMVDFAAEVLEEDGGDASTVTSTARALDLGSGNGCLSLNLLEEVRQYGDGGG